MRYDKTYHYYPTQHPSLHLAFKWRLMPTFTKNYFLLLFFLSLSLSFLSNSSTPLQIMGRRNKTKIVPSMNKTWERKIIKKEKLRGLWCAQLLSSLCALSFACAAVRGHKLCRRCFRAVVCRESACPTRTNLWFVQAVHLTARYGDCGFGVVSYVFNVLRMFRRSRTSMPRTMRGYTTSKLRRTFRIVRIPQRLPHIPRFKCLNRPWRIRFLRVNRKESWYVLISKSFSIKELNEEGVQKHIKGGLAWEHDGQKKNLQINRTSTYNETRPTTATHAAKLKRDKGFFVQLFHFVEATWKRGSYQYAIWATNIWYFPWNNCASHWVTRFHSCNPLFCRHTVGW